MLTFFRNYFTITGVKKGYEYGGRILLKTENRNAPPRENIFSKKFDKECLLRYN